MKFILGQKLEMSQLFDDQGKAIPVTLIKAGPCFVTQIKTKEEDGYRALQLGFKKIQDQEKIKKTMRGKPYRFLKEFRVKPDKFEMGQKIDVSVFNKGDQVKVSGISKGKGFAGVIKRWGFAGMPASHGHKKGERRGLGSTGRRFPQRVEKGRKMPGRMGGDRVTVENLEVVKVDPERNLMAVKGAVPGNKGGLLEVRSVYVH